MVTLISCCFTPMPSSQPDNQYSPDDKSDREAFKSAELPQLSQSEANFKTAAELKDALEKYIFIPTPSHYQQAFEEAVKLANNGKFSGALEYFQVAAKVADMALNPKDYRQIQVRASLGFTYITLERTAQAIAAFEEALELIKEYGGSRYVQPEGLSLRLIQAYTKDKLYEKAREVSEEFLERNQSPNSVIKTQIRLELMQVYKILGQNTEASKALQQAFLDVTRIPEHEISEEVIASLLGIGESCLSDDDLVEAKHLADTALNFIKKTNVSEILEITCYRLLSETYAEMGDLDQAIEWRVKALKCCKSSTDSTKDAADQFRQELCDLLSEQGKLDKVEKIQGQLLTQTVKRFPNDEAKQVEQRLLLVKAQLDNCRLTAAQEQVQTCLELLRASMPEDILIVLEKEASEIDEELPIVIQALEADKRPELFNLMGTYAEVIYVDAMISAQLSQEHLDSAYQKEARSFVIAEYVVPASSVVVKAQVNFRHATAIMHNDQVEEALQYCEEGLLLLENDDQSTRYSGLLLRARLKLRQNNFQEAKQDLMEVKRYYEQRARYSNALQMVSVLKLEAGIEIKQHELFGNKTGLVSAEKLLVNAKNILESRGRGDGLMMIETMSSLGELYEELGEYERAKELEVQVKNLFGKLDVDNDWIFGDQFGGEF